MGEKGELLTQAWSRLAELLPDRFQLVKQRASTDRGADALWLVRDADGDSAQLLVLAKRSVTPREAQRIAASRIDMWAPGEPTLLVVTSWFSPRTREVLKTQGFSYLDLAGNALLAVDRPAIFVSVRGADRSPSPAPRPPARLRGSKARRLSSRVRESRFRSICSSRRRWPGPGGAPHGYHHTPGTWPGVPRAWKRRWPTRATS
ncbi:hypothetical protein ACN27G_36420 [Plantactinospora sp. WMMB334]|uniref:hypothetical protein n=1 Tax=Plantactinospora sp. WMMB334 TaxID=3404119 RepID=UPI003B923894